MYDFYKHRDHLVRFDGKLARLLSIKINKLSQEV